MWSACSVPGTLRAPCFMLAFSCQRPESNERKQNRSDGKPNITFKTNEATIRACGNNRLPNTES